MSLDQNSIDSLRIDRSATPAPGNRRVLPWILVGLLPVAALLAWWLLRSPVIEVTVASAVATANDATPRGATVLDASGYVVARREATVSSKVTGKIAEVLIEEGMSVRRGQVVARLDQQSLRPELDLASTQLRARRTEREEAKVRHAVAARNLDRIQRLRKDGLVSEADLDAVKAEHDALAARLDALAGAIEVSAASVRVYEQQLDDLTVRAPFDGVIVSKDAQPGEMVSPVSAGGGFTRTGIATLVDMESREIEVDVNEAFINRVSAGQRTEATLDAYPDWRIPSHVINIVPTADRQKATVRVRIAFDELDPRILPNMGIKVSFMDPANPSGPPAEVGAAPARTRVQVPTAAAMRDGDASIVWRVRDGKAERVAVSTGNERNGQTELLSGIDAGDTVIVGPVAQLAPGVSVRPASN